MWRSGIVQDARQEGFLADLPGLQALGKVKECSIHIWHAIYAYHVSSDNTTFHFHYSCKHDWS